MRIRNSYARIPFGETVLNWGKSNQIPNPGLVKQINPIHSSGIICNKRTFGAANFSDAVEFTTNRVEAKEWVSVAGAKVVCRELLNSHSGRGIVIARNPDQVIDAPLYSKYFRKTREYRVYVGWAVDEDGIVNDDTYITYLASKRNPTEQRVEDRDALLIRSAEQGWVYQMEDTEGMPEAVRATIDSFAVELTDKTHDDDLGDYGWLLALDILYHAEDDAAKIVEANLAPGLNNGSASQIVELANWIEQQWSNEYE